MSTEVKEKGEEKRSILEDERGLPLCITCKNKSKYMTCVVNGKKGLPTKIALENYCLGRCYEDERICKKK